MIIFRGCSMDVAYASFPTCIMNHRLRREFKSLEFTQQTFPYTSLDAFTEL